MKQAFVAGLLGLAAAQAMACYTVYGRSGAVLYKAQTAPVDMSRPISDTLPGRFPGGHMIFDTQTDCASIATRASQDATQAAPLLTDERTARAMKVPYTVLRAGVVLVQPRDARMRPGVTVVPASAVAPAGLRGREGASSGQR